MQAPLEYDHEERTRFLVEAIQHQATNAQLAQASTPPTSHAFLLALLGVGRVCRLHLPRRRIELRGAGLRL